MKTMGCTIAALVCCALGPAWAADTGPVKIGVLTESSGVYADLAGPGSIVAAKMAVEDFGGSVNGRPIEVISADHQNKADIAVSIARQWFDTEGVDMIVDLPNSSVAAAVAQIGREKRKPIMITNPGDSDLTGSKCSPYSVHWTYDTWALAHGTGSAIASQGGKTWFFITADYTFGHAITRDTTAVVKANGGTVVGGVEHPLDTHDMSSYLLQAQASHAQVIGLADAGSDLIGVVKQAKEFNVGRPESGQQLAGLLVFLSDVDSLGLDAAQGLELTTAFYWDANDGTRAWTKRYAARNGGKYPNMSHAGVYAAVLHYLKAVKAAGTTDGAAVMQQMKAIPTNDPLFGQGHVRVDGRVTHNMYLYRVKTPAGSHGRWDYYQLVRTIPEAQAFRPLDEGGCPLVRP